MKDEPLENNIVSLHGRGWSIHRLSNEFCISRARVRRILKKNSQNRDTLDNGSKPAKGKSKLDIYKPYISSLLEKYKDPPITNQRVFELLEEKGFDGKITIVRNYLAGLRGKKTKDPIVSVETLPGQRASHDWSDYYINFTDGQLTEKITFFSYILNYSRRQYIEIVEDKTQPTLLRSLVNAFIYFDGAVHEIKSDNQKACVDRWELGKPVFNNKYLGFATHYRFRPLTITPGKPRENLKVERPFYYLETNFLNGRQFSNIKELKEQLHLWLTQRNDKRVHRTTGKAPIDLYKQELAYLQPLPMAQYDTSTIEYRVVNNESAVQWDNYFYIVPKQYMYETCTVRANEKEITIYSGNYKQIAVYPIAEKGRKDRYIGRSTVAKKHHVPAKQLIERLNEFGPLMQEYTSQIKKAKPNSYHHHWQHILSLKVNYQVSDILTAVKRALNYRIFETRAIENFLNLNAEKKSEYKPSRKTSHND